MYYLSYDAAGLIIGAYHPAVHGKDIPIYNTEPIITQDAEGSDITQAIGTVQIGTILDLSAIPAPYIEITDSEHSDWVQNQATRKIDIDTKKLVEYTPPEPAPVIITPTTNQDLADLWEAMLTMSAGLEALKGEK